MDLDTIGRWLGWAMMAGYVALTASEVVRYFTSALKPAPEPAGAMDAPVSLRPEGLDSLRPEGLASLRPKGLASLRRRRDAKLVL